MALVDNVPADWIFSAFSIGRNQLPYAAMAVLAGGNIRVGLEDNIWLDKGVLATNGQLVERAVTVAEGMGARDPRPRRGAREAEADESARRWRRESEDEGHDHHEGRRASAAASSAPAGSRGCC